MVIVDMKMPDRCGDCMAMRCSKCILSDSKNIMEYQANKTRPEWCPVVADVSVILNKMNKSKENTRPLADNDEFFKGRIRGIEFTEELLNVF